MDKTNYQIPSRFRSLFSNPQALSAAAVARAANTTPNVTRIFIPRSSDILVRLLPSLSYRIKYTSGCPVGMNRYFDCRYHFAFENSNSNWYTFFVVRENETLTKNDSVFVISILFRQILYCHKDGEAGKWITYSNRDKLENLTQTRKLSKA